MRMAVMGCLCEHNDNGVAGVCAFKMCESMCCLCIHIHESYLGFCCRIGSKSRERGARLYCVRLWKIVGNLRPCCGNL